MPHVAEQRREVYALFVQYQTLHELHGWWDDMDRAMQVLRPNLSVLQQQEQSGEVLLTRGIIDSPNIRSDKVYVDEVQDSTQGRFLCTWWPWVAAWTRFSRRGTPRSRWWRVWSSASRRCARWCTY